jgi:hypothetical protein
MRKYTVFQSMHLGPNLRTALTFSVMSQAFVNWNAAYTTIEIRLLVEKAPI